MSVQSSDVATRYPAPTVQSKGRPFTIAAFICAGLALLFGLLAGVPGIILGIVAVSKGDKRLGGWSIAACVAAAIVSAIIANAILNAADDNTTGAILGLL